MKKLLVLAVCLIALKGYSQNTAKIKHIDSLVVRINDSRLPARYDSTIQDNPEAGVRTRTYITSILDSTSLKKYVSAVSTVQTENGISTQTTNSTAFYYDQGKLIKVEELILTKGDRQRLDWYYSDDIPLYYTSKSENAKSRAIILVSMGNAVLAQVLK